VLNFNKSKQNDAYKKSSFSFLNKIRRLLWGITWFVFCKWTPVPLHFWRIFVLKVFGAKIGEFNYIYPTCKIWAPWSLETEDVVTIGPYVEIYNPGGVFLGHHTILSQGAYLCGATHDYNSISFTYIKKKISLEPYVWICAKAVVLPGTYCKEGSVLGAMSIISGCMEAWTVYAGNPAKIVKQRRNFLK
jgi:putative colanic acid biosynthesis acetyltransferase WcaF